MKLKSNTASIPKVDEGKERAKTDIPHSWSNHDGKPGFKRLTKCNQYPQNKKENFQLTCTLFRVAIIKETFLTSILFMCIWPIHRKVKHDSSSLHQSAPSSVISSSHTNENQKIIWIFKHYKWISRRKLDPSKRSNLVGEAKWADSERSELYGY